MVKSVENGTTLPPFLVKCYEMVNDESTNELISWTESNDSFVIWDESKFASELLPKYFKHSNFSSFVRQLNIYGFRKIDTDLWQFANESFIKGQKHLLKNIIRRKQPQTPAHKNPPPQQKGVNAPQQSEEERRLALWKEVENLKTDKNLLSQQLKKLRQHQQISQSKLLLVREQLQGMEENQQQMLSFIVMAMQSPEFMVQFFQPKENNNNSRNKLSEVVDDCGPSDDKMIVPYQPLKDDHLDLPVSSPETSNLEDFMDGDFFEELDFLIGSVNDKVGPTLESDVGKLVLPDASEKDFTMEELLSGNLSTENVQFAESADDDDGDDMTEFGGQSESSDKVEVITKKMGSLASEMR